MATKTAQAARLNPAQTRHKPAQARLNNVPGAIYLNKNRYWWKVQLPGETKPVARPLVPLGSKFATTDSSVAGKLAINLYQQSIYQNCTGPIETVTSIASLVRAYHDHAKIYYRTPDGKATKEPDNIKYACVLLLKHYAAISPEEFGPLRLIELRDYMIKEKLARGVINQRIGMIRRMFKWAASRQFISPILYQGLATVEGLRAGRSAAKETARVKPIEDQYVYAILPYTTPVVAAMTELQLLTGMRPAELSMMRPCDIDRSKEIWHYTPGHHKTSYRQIERIVSIGPRGQEILRPFLLRPAEAYCFSPIESEKYRRAKLTEARETPPSHGNSVGTNRKENPQVQPGNCYDSESYRKAITHAIRAANKAISEQAKQQGIKDPELIPDWTPYRMRHTAATKVRKEMGYETAGATLGHTNMSATEIYAERNQGLADEAARRLG
jgi:integrase